MRISKAILSILILLLAVPAVVRGDDDPEKELKKKAKAAVKEFKKAYPKARDAGDREDLVDDLAATGLHEDIAKAILGVTTGDPEMDVRIAAAEYLKAYKDDKKIAKMIWSAFNANKKFPDVQATLLEALAEAGDENYLKTMQGLVSHKDRYVARAAVNAIIKWKHPSSVEALLDELKELDAKFVDPDDPTGTGGTSGTSGSSTEMREAEREAEERRAKRNATLRKPIREALEAICKEDFTDYKDWSAWWKSNKNKVWARYR